MPSFRSMFSSIFGKVKKIPQNLKHFRLLNGYIPVVSNTNNTEAYYNYLFRACLRAIATHVAKADIKHIRYVNNDTIPQDSDIANLLGGQPNPFMNSSEFIFKLTTNLLIHNNAFVYIKQDEKGTIRIPTGTTGAVPGTRLAVIRQITFRAQAFIIHSITTSFYYALTSWETGAGGNGTVL